MSKIKRYTPLLIPSVKGHRCVVDSTLDIPKEMFESLYEIIAPTIEANNDAPLWKLITIAYAQGLENGFGVGRAFITGG